MRITRNLFCSIALAGDFGSKTLIFVIVGCIIFLFVCLCILWIWKTKFQPVNGKLLTVDPLKTKINLNYI